MVSFVFTECTAGIYGYNCLNNCSNNCGVPGACDRVTGHCDGKCQTGWQGDTCESGNDSIFQR